MYLIEEIIETNKETYQAVFEKIEESKESIDFIYSVIEYAIKIRPLNIVALRSLHNLLVKKYGCKNNRFNISFKKESALQKNELMIFAQDDLDSFIKKSQEVGFNPKSKVKN